VTRRSLLLRSVPALVLLLAGCGTGGEGEGTTAAAPGEVTGTVSGRCADLVVIGARGSTQNADLNSGVGTELRLTTQHLIDRLADRTDLTVRLEAIRYDASAAASLAAFETQTVAGTQLMTDRLQRLARACRESRFALIGFSQGAQVVHGAAAQMASDLADRVALVAMIADPRTDPDDRIAHWSYADEPTRGDGRLGPGPPIDPDLRGAAISLCVEGDEICNDLGDPGGPRDDVHERFYEQDSSARETAAQLDRVLATNGV
jgi:cutinase